VVLFPLVLYIHNKVEDSPEFKELQARSAERMNDAPAQAPALDVVRKAWKRILLGCLTMGATNSMFYVGIVGSLSYASSELGMKRESLLLVTLVLSALNIPMILWSGALSDRIGRKPVVFWSAIGLAVVIFPYFALLGTKSIA
ncbi:MFS transporter, partial [Pseudomonas sp. 100_A]|uniref:MFS transporter n=1 Tax=Pseudomonas sp. 100_A TaxID=2813571 RepID=UPI001A9D2783